MVSLGRLQPLIDPTNNGAPLHFLRRKGGRKRGGRRKEERGRTKKERRGENEPPMVWWLAPPLLMWFSFCPKLLVVLIFLDTTNNLGWREYVSLGF